MAMGMGGTGGVGPAGTSGHGAGSSGGWGGIDRPDRGPYGGTQVPNYGWEDARLSDFGLLGGLSNLVGGVMSGNTYSGRTPRGFTTSQQRDMGALGAGAVGNTGQGRSLQPQYGGAMPNFSVGRAGIGGYGLQAYKRDLARQQAARQPAVAPAPVQTPQPVLSYVPQMFLGTGGQYGYGQMRPGYSFYGPPGGGTAAQQPKANPALLRFGIPDGVRR